jgi:hypothetical protein
MQRFRPRVTLRWLMVAVAVASLASWWLITRRERFKRLASYHKTQVWKDARDHGGRKAIEDTPLTRWHLSLSGKYDYAVTHPWLPVAGDPPEPPMSDRSALVVPQPQ